MLPLPPFASNSWHIWKFREIADSRVSINKAWSADPIQYGRQIHLKLDGDIVPESRHFQLFRTAEGQEKYFSDWPIRRIIPSEISLDYCAGIITNWLSACLVSHRNCKDAEAVTPSTMMPARLIFVGTRADDTIKVVDIVDPRLIYVALSYCWGAGLRSTLTKDTINSFRGSISWDLIPKTLQDAISLTVNLQIPYIWIDALCILQDSPEDWQRESLKMRNIYKQARLIISADRAATTDTGFLTSRRQASHIIQLPNFPEASHSAQILAIQIGDGHRIHEKDPYYEGHQWFLSSGESFTSQNDFVLRNPVFGRGWCLQEQILAPRTVHFTDSEMIWECFDDSCCECEGINEYNRCLSQRLSTIFSSNKIPEPQLWKRTWFNLRSMREPLELLREWWGCVEQYSSRKLGIESDILPAISGLAKDFPEDVMGKYHAGQWSTDFPYGLLWYTQRFLHQHRRAEHYTAPSWSWASVIGVIERPPLMISPVALAKVTDVMISPVGSDCYGQIQDASLVLTAPMIHNIHVSYCRKDRQWKFEPPEREPPERETKEFFFGPTEVYLDLINELTFGITLDEPEESSFSSHKWTCAFIAKDISQNLDTDGQSEIIYALLVIPVSDKNGAFERIGLATFHHLSEGRYKEMNLAEHTISVV